MYNRCMAHARVTNENAFADLLNTWGSIGHKRTNKLGSMPLAKHVAVVCLLHNCAGIASGNQMTYPLCSY